MKSLSALLSAWPMWMSPLENGGPSCRLKRGLPSFFLSISWYRSMSYQRWSISGSRLARPARMGKSVFGRLIVALKSFLDMVLSFSSQSCISIKNCAGRYGTGRPALVDCMFTQLLCRK